MDSKFTKGKWKINTPNDSNGYQVIKCEDGLNIATCFGVLERTIPNAKLIESAPDMFEMLKSMLSESDDIIHSEIKLEIEKLLTKITEL